jgi:hypothetical protein
LPVIAEKDRRAEDELNAQLAEMTPRVLGALYDAVSGALREMPRTVLDSVPRMADFAKWSTAAETALGWTRGTALGVYRRNRGELVESSLEADAVAVAVRSLLEKRADSSWSGTAADLYDALRPSATPPPRDWPDTAKALSNRMRRLAPHLRAVGITWTPRERRSNRGQLYDLVKGDPPKPPSPPSPPSPAEGTSCDGRQKQDAAPSQSPPRPSPTTSGDSTTRDGGDGRDGDFATAASGLDEQEARKQPPSEVT